MLNSCLRDSFIELSHCNRHFAIKGKTSVTFPNFPFPRVIKFLESLSILTCIGSREISRNEFVTATAISEELIVCFIFHLQMKQSFFFTFCLTPQLVKLLLIFLTEDSFSSVVFLYLSYFKPFSFISS